MSPTPEQDNFGTISTSHSSSLRGHPIGFSCEVIRLLSPNQPHRISSNYERDLTAAVNHVEYDIEAPPSASTAPSKACSIPEAKDGHFKIAHRATFWKYVGMILGFLFAG
jgi:hypothetical protein